MPYIISVNLEDESAQQHYQKKFKEGKVNFSQWVVSKLLEDKSLEDDPDYFANLIALKKSEIASIERQYQKSKEKIQANEQIKAEDSNESKRRKKEERERRLHGYAVSMGIYLTNISMAEADKLSLEYDKSKQSNPELTVRDFLISKGHNLKPLKACVTAMSTVIQSNPKEVTQ